MPADLQCVSLKYHYYSHVIDDYDLIGGDDYDAGPYDIAMPAGVTRLGLDLVLFDDNVPEANETFQLIITTRSLPDGFRHGDRATVTIVDNDNG